MNTNAVALATNVLAQELLLELISRRILTTAEAKALLERGQMRLVKQGPRNPTNDAARAVLVALSQSLESPGH